MVVAIVHNKGGVGKTTVAVNLAAALTRPRRRVLLVDLDSQAAASRWCGVDRARLKPSIASCLLDGYPLSRAIRPTAIPRLDLLTASVELASADLALCNVPGRETTLKTLLAPVRGTYDIILLDCPPSLSLVCINALVAADALLVPVTPQFLAMEALIGLLASIDKVRSRLGARPKLLGLLMTMGGERTGAARERLRSEYGERVLPTEIPRASLLEEASAACVTIFELSPRSKVAHAFRQLATDVMERLPSRH